MRISRFLAVAALVILLMFVAACGRNGGNDSPEPTETPADTPAPPDVNEPLEVPDLPPDAYDGVTNFRIVPEGETTEITVFYTFGGLGTIHADQAIFRAAEEMTGVRINNIANPNIAEADEALVEMMLTGNIAELIQAHDNELGPQIDEGLFMDISELIFAYAPNIVRYFNLIPPTRVASTHHDGGIYVLRGALHGADSPNPQPSKLFFIRYDWLEELDLPVPTTLEEFRDTLYAFRDANLGDPDSQTIPFFARQADIHTLLQLWGVQGDWARWYIDDGVVGHGMFSEAYRAAIIELAQWYADGVIDPEIFGRGSMARQELLASNQGGVVVDWPGSTGALNYNEEIREQVPDLDWRYMRIPANVNGVVRSEWGRGSVSPFGWGIYSGVSRERAIEIVRFMDFWFSEPGEMLTNYGVEGYSFEFVNGEPQFLPHALAHEGGIPNFMRTLGSQGFPSMPANIEFEIGAFADSIRDGYLDHLNNVTTIDPFPALSYLPGETAAINAVDWSFMYEFHQGAILGTVDIEAMWDAYIEEARRAGVFDAMEAKQTALDRYMATMY
ncbi:MAG: extracellular solute-binding protein [Defluviitaleaceae bacterium]|nr:extracellular solute-binding protein [Defluviitaleaceae bacterium]